MCCGETGIEHGEKRKQLISLFHTPCNCLLPDSAHRCREKGRELNASSIVVGDRIVDVHIAHCTAGWSVSSGTYGPQPTLRRRCVSNDAHLGSRKQNDNESWTAAASSNDFAFTRTYPELQCNVCKSTTRWDRDSMLVGRYRQVELMQVSFKWKAGGGKKYANWISINYIRLHFNATVWMQIGRVHWIAHAALHCEWGMVWCVW